MGRKTNSKIERMGGVLEGAIARHKQTRSFLWYFDDSFLSKWYRSQWEVLCWTNSPTSNFCEISRSNAALAAVTMRWWSSGSQGEGPWWDSPKNAEGAGRCHSKTTSSLIWVLLVVQTWDRVMKKNWNSIFTVAISLSLPKWPEIITVMNKEMMSLCADLSWLDQWGP